MHADKSFSYTPNTRYVGADSFTYTWSDGMSESMLATVTIEVYNNAATAQGEFFMLQPGQSFAVFLNDSVPSGYTGVAVTLSSLLVNDWDPDGDALEFVLAGTPSPYWQFDETLNAWVFGPPADFEGIDANFVYFVTDGIPFDSHHSGSHNASYTFSASWSVVLELQVGQAGEAMRLKLGRLAGADGTLYPAWRVFGDVKLPEGARPVTPLFTAYGEDPNSNWVNMVGKGSNFVSIFQTVWFVGVVGQGVIDFEFEANNTGGVREFWFEIELGNLSRNNQAWQEVEFQLGYGVLDRFEHSADRDGLDFDMRDDTDEDIPEDHVSPGSAILITQEHPDRLLWEEDKIVLKLINPQPAGKATQYFMAVDIPDWDAVPPSAVIANQEAFRFTIRVLPR